MSVESITAEFVDLGRKGSRKILLGLSGSEEKGQSSKGDWPFFCVCEVKGTGAECRYGVGLSEGGAMLENG